MARLASPLVAGEVGDRAAILFESFRAGAAVNELAFLASLDQTRIVQNAKMVGDRGGGNVAKGAKLAAIEFIGLGNRLEEKKASLVGEGLGNAFDPSSIHG